MHIALLALYRRRSYVSVTLDARHARANFVEVSLNVAYPYSQRKYVALDGRHRSEMPYVALDVPVYGATGVVSVSMRYTARKVVSSVSLEGRHAVLNFSIVPLHVYYSAASGGFVRLLARYRKKSLFGVGLQARYVAFTYKSYHLIGLYTYKAERERSTEASVSLDVIVREEAYQIRDAQSLSLQCSLAMSGAVNVDTFVSDAFLLHNASSLGSGVDFFGPHDFAADRMVDTAEESVPLLKIKIPVRADTRTFYLACFMSAVRRPMSDFYGPRMTLRVTRRIKSYRYGEENATIGIRMPAAKIRKQAYVIDSPGVYRLESANRFYILSFRKPQIDNIAVADTGYRLWMEFLYVVGSAPSAASSDIVDLDVDGRLKSALGLFFDLYDLPEYRKVTEPYFPFYAVDLDISTAMEVDDIVLPCSGQRDIRYVESSRFAFGVRVDRLTPYAKYRLEPMRIWWVVGGYVTPSLLHGDCIACAPWCVFAGTPTFIPTKHAEYVSVAGEYVLGRISIEGDSGAVDAETLYYAGALRVGFAMDADGIAHPLTLHIDPGRFVGAVYHGPHLQEGPRKNDVSDLRLMFYFIIRSGSVPTIYSEPMELEVAYG